MDAVGRDVLPTLDELREALEKRRKDTPPALKVIFKLIGLEMKMRQYEQGRAFCDAVVDAGGIEALNRVWIGPGMLPTLGELEAPELWLARTAPPAAAA
jgi:putative hydrolase